MHIHKTSNIISQTLTSAVSYNPFPVIFSNASQ